MGNLFDSPFLQSVRGSFQNSQNLPPDVLIEQLDNFTSLLYSIVGKEQSLISLTRQLRTAHIELCSCLSNPAGYNLSNSSLLLSLVGKARSLIQVEIDIVALRIEHFGLCDNDITPVSEIYWSKDYSVSDLVELILSLHRSGALCYRDGSPASLSAIVRLVERSYNVQIKDFRGLKKNVTTRKMRFTKFLDVLSSNFIELCESRRAVR